MKLIIKIYFLILSFDSLSFGEDSCTSIIKNFNILSDVNSDKVFLIQHINGQQPIKHTLTNAQSTIANSPTFDKTKTMIIVIHGYIPSTLGGPEIQNLITTLKKKNLNNVFELDWKTYADSANYPKVVVDMKKIGELLGTTLSNLDKIGVYGYHLIGHSLGAHMSGFAGKQFNTLSSDKLDRITGLDPANPCFLNELPKDRLNSADAFFVDVIHTDAQLGMSKAIGLADFYPNGGDDMPGLFSRDHILCVNYFAESVNDDNFISVKCADWNTFKSGACKTNTPQVKMGFYTPTTASGNYYLKTAASSLYALGTAGLS